MNSSGEPSAPLTIGASPIAILGVPFDPVNLDEAVRLVGTMIESRQPHYAVTANVDFIVQARTDTELRQIIFDAHLVLCDGMPLVWASRFLGNPLPERVAGSDLTPRLLQQAEQRNWRVFFLGGSEQSVQRAAEQTLTRHPRLRLVGAYSPPFKPLHEMDHAGILSRISAARPDILFVAFGCPKQEKWINMHYRHLGVPVCIGIGATIDFIAGTQVRAPRWMQRTGTEWIHRLVRDPRRLASRYGKGLLVFGSAIVAQARQLRTRPRISPATAANAAANAAPVAAPAFPPAPNPATTSPASRPAIPILQAPERLDAAAAARVMEAWVAAIRQGPLTLDLQGCSFVDSTGIGLLARLQKTATQHRQPLVLARARKQLLRALELMRLERSFTLADELPTRLPAGTGVSAELDPRPVAAAFGLELTWVTSIVTTTVPHLAEAAFAAVASLQPGTSLRVDLSGVPFIDSSGLSFLVGLKKRAWQRDVDVVFANPVQDVRRVLRITQLENFLLGPRLPRPEPPAGTGASPRSTAPAPP